MNHTRGDQLCDTEGAGAVYCDNVPYFLLWRLAERHWDAVALTDIVDQDGDIQPCHQVLERGIVGVLVRRKVHCEHFRLHLVLRLDLRREGIELRLGAGDEEDIEASRGELLCVFFANAVRGSCYHRPCSFLAEFGELCHLVINAILFNVAVLHLTEIPGRMNNEAISLQKEKIFMETKRMPMKAKTCVVGDAHGSSWGMASMVVFTPWIVYLSDCEERVEESTSVSGGLQGAGRQCSLQTKTSPVQRKRQIKE